jgi:hypothetical protein
MAFELKPGQGSMFKNDRKQGERDPDYKGSVIDTNGFRRAWGTSAYR